MSYKRSLVLGLTLNKSCSLTLHSNADPTNVFVESCMVMASGG